jgi:predicted dehydrogenase
MGITNRRTFLRTSTAAGLWIVGSGSNLRAESANEQVNVAVIGVGGRGAANLEGIAAAGGRIVALCDVDNHTLEGAATKHPKARTFHDFRRMLDDFGKEIDAVVVSTPDHTHATAANLAMKMGKHCYCEKPLTHSINEARTLTRTAATMKLATQMGNSGQSSENTRRIVELVRSGAIGSVREVHAWTNRPIWPQGLDRPADVDPVPEHLNWDLWIGPAPYRPFVRDAYHPFKWRGWWDFGTGALGDMACHVLNAAYWALDLKYPTAVEVEAGEPRKADNGPKWEIIRYEFPARGELPPVTVRWYDGGQKPSADLLDGLKPSPSGSIFVGEKGRIHIAHEGGGRGTLLPEERFKDFEAPRPTLPRSPGHHKDFLSACQDPGGYRACSNFDYSGPLTEMVLLGVLAFRVGKKIVWDGPAMSAKNCPEAEQFVRREYRRGWEL